MAFSALSGWTALTLVPVTALAAWALRRFGRGTFVRRLRLHFVFGYAAVAFAAVHLFTTMSGVAGANTVGIRLASLAFVTLCAQAFVGASLQQPGSYRFSLRRWHLTLFAVIAVSGTGHIVLNR